MPKVSFIIPVYNVEKFLPACLRSIADQTVGDWEAVCVNDGSTDGSLGILEKFASDDGRFRIIDNPHGGLSATRNRGLESACGEFIIYVDSDDSIHPQLLETALSIQTRSGADIVTWYKDRIYRIQQRLARIIGKDSDNIAPLSFRRKYNVSKVRFNLTDDLVTIATEKANSSIRNAVVHNYVWRSMIRAELARQVKFTEGITFEDFPWWSEMLLHNPVAATTRLPLYCYRWNPESIDNGSALAGKLSNWALGMESIWRTYLSKATPHQMECWSRNIKWPVIYYQLARHLNGISPEHPEYGKIAAIMQRLDRDGLFDDASTRADRWSVRKIRELYGI